MNVNPQTSDELWELPLMLSNCETGLLLTPSQHRPFNAATNHWKQAFGTHEQFMHWASPDVLPINPPPKRPAYFTGRPEELFPGRVPAQGRRWAKDIVRTAPFVPRHSADGISPTLAPFVDEAPFSRNAFERARPTGWDTIQGIEVWPYKAVLVENVVEVAIKWQEPAN